MDIDFHQGIQRLVRDLNHLYVSEPALHEQDFDWAGFEWLDFHDWESSVISFLRRGKEPGSEIVAVFNFTPVARRGYRVGVPLPGHWKEVLNSDSGHYSGSNVGNGNGVHAEAVPSHGRPCSLELDLPPLGVCVLKHA